MTAGDALGGLLQLEQRIEREIAAARAAAERRVEAARAAAHQLESEAGDSLREALEGLRAAIDAEAEAAIQQLERDARSEAEIYRSADETVVRELARRVAARITVMDAPK